MTSLHIGQKATDNKRHTIRLTVRRPGVTDIKAEATFTLTYYRRTLLQ